MISYSIGVTPCRGCVRKYGLVSRMTPWVHIELAAYGANERAGKGAVKRAKGGGERVERARAAAAVQPRECRSLCAADFHRRLSNQ